jgi:hypothetical protein
MCCGNPIVLLEMAIRSILMAPDGSRLVSFIGDRQRTT